MGFDAEFFARIHDADRSKRWDNKEMELIWKASDDLGDNGSIFSGVLWRHYYPPDGFCFEGENYRISSSNSPIYSLILHIRP